MGSIQAGDDACARPETSNLSTPYVSAESERKNMLM